LLQRKITTGTQDVQSMHFHWKRWTFAAVCCIATIAAAQKPSEENLTTNARFLVAARDGDAEAMKRALAQGAAVDSRNRLGESALVIVLKKDRVDLAQLVLDAGADVNQPAVNGITPLMAAAFGGHTDIAKQLLAKGASPAALDRLQKNAMTYAAGAGRTDIVATLLAHGVDANAVYANDLTALMWAAGFGKADTVRVLLAAGANPALKDNRGKTAADIARAEGFVDTVAILETKK
jgi:ankyrin repeat protein